MPYPKRKRDDYEDSDEEEPSFGRQILPVANLPEDFSGEPEDGMQYLFMVRRDARYLPHVTRVANPYEISESDQTSLPSGSILAHPELPSDEWCSLFERRFRNFRKNINQSTIHVNAQTQQRVIPNKRERDLWWAFLSGKPESEWNLPSRHKKHRQAAQSQDSAPNQGLRGWAEPDSGGTPSEASTSEIMITTTDEGEVEEELKIDPGESLPTPSGTPGPETLESESSSTASTCSELLVPREPSTSIMRQIDERMALHLLKYFTYWMNAHLQNPDPQNHLLTDVHARWIFALLSRIDDHISADDMNLLRNLSRACLAWLKVSIQDRIMSARTGPLDSTSARKSAMSEQSCWLILSTVVSIWKQRDLWMDAEQVLRNAGSSA